MTVGFLFALAAALGIVCCFRCVLWSLCAAAVAAFAVAAFAVAAFAVAAVVAAASSTLPAQKEWILAPTTMCGCVCVIGRHEWYPLVSPKGLPAGEVQAQIVVKPLNLDEPDVKHKVGAG